MPDRNLKPIKVLFLSAEAAPLVKVGGLADAVGALPAELRRMGHDVRLALPLHPALRSRVKDAKPVARPKVSTRSVPMQAEVYLLEQGGVPVYLIDGPPLRAPDAVYHADAGRDAPKYVFFSLAALELARELRWKPDIVHTNDWHTAAANLWIAGRGQKDRHFANVRSILSIHNLPYFGQNAGWALAQFGLGVPANTMNVHSRRDADAPVGDRYAALPYWALSALLPLGIASADLILTVSPSYAEEMLTPEFGAGLEEYLQTQKHRLIGILNGLDTQLWDPAGDPRLAANYDLSSTERRAANRAALSKEVGLTPNSDAPLLGIVSRLSEQKGMDLALPALEIWCSRGNQAVILGTGDPWLEQRCQAFAARHAGRAGVSIGYDDELAARIYGGSDFFLIPSRYEPCGISQMIAMRYGSVPIAHAVGGLKDTIQDLSREESTGILFPLASSEAAAWALGRAEELFRSPERRKAVQARCMKTDFSWTASVEAYLAAYRRVLST